jgi:WD40 repeat protein
MTAGGLTPYSLAFSPDGKLLCMGAQSGTHIWKLTDKDQVKPWLARHAVAGRIVGRAAFTPDGQSVVTAYRSDWPAVYVWKPDTPENMDRSFGVPRPVCSFALACDGRHVAVGTDQGTVYVLRLSFPPLRPRAR